MIRKEIYNGLARALAEIPGNPVKHVDLWNHNVEFIEQEEAWERPAVFVEFGPISWDAVKGYGGRGKGTLRLHIVADWPGSAAAGSGSMEEALGIFELSDTVREAVQDAGIDGLRLLETLTNHNHEEIVENIDVYAYRCMK